MHVAWLCQVTYSRDRDGNSVWGVQSMILPTKYAPESESLLLAGAVVLEKLDRPQTVTELWEATRGEWITTFGHFVLALEMLFVIGVVSFCDGLLEKHQVPSGPPPSAADQEGM